jgi:MoxR-like ATPase
MLCMRIGQNSRHSFDGIHFRGKIMTDVKQSQLDRALSALDRLRQNGRTQFSKEGVLFCHDWSEREIDALQVALVTRRPLLLRGEPGSGKTQLARAAAHELDWKLHAMTVHPRMEPNEVLYRFDAVERLAWAQNPKLRKELQSNRFYEPGPLWWALDWESARRAHALRKGKQDVSVEPPAGHVVLIDEIDKADSDLPNSLLEVFGERALSLPCEPHALTYHACETPPLILLTTNEDRELPAPFERRCIVLSLEVRADDVAWLVRHRGKAHFNTSESPDQRPFLPIGVMEKAAELLMQERERFDSAGLRLPGVAEYLDLLHALHDLKQQQGWNGAELESRVTRLAPYLFRKHGGEHLPDELQQWRAPQG